jgi:hypothetical protein
MRIQPIVYPTTLKGKNREKGHKDAETYEPINLADVFGEVEDTDKPPSQKDAK